MENDIMTSKLTSSELKEILAGVPMSYYMNSSTARQNWSNITSAEFNLQMQQNSD